MKKIELKQTGYYVSGRSWINLWGGGEGEIEMDGTFIPLDKFSKDNLCSCINDGQFGCESIESADVDVYVQYENGFRVFDRTIFVTSRHHLRFACRGI